jgi:hypothetical protein
MSPLESPISIASTGGAPPIARPAGVCDPERFASQPSLRQEIATVAAQLIADRGFDYRSAKSEAASEVLEGRSAARNLLPDNVEVDTALASHLDLFDDQHAERVARMRAVARELMLRLAAFRPHLTGAVWKGIVAEHAVIHLQLFHDDPKEIVLLLLDAGVHFDAIELPALGSGGGVVEGVAFEFQGEPVQLALHPADALRQAARSAQAIRERGDLQALDQLNSPEHR